MKLTTITRSIALGLTVVGPIAGASVPFFAAGMAPNLEKKVKTNPSSTTLTRVIARYSSTSVDPSTLAPSVAGSVLTRTLRNGE
jgi:hypothetical protein